MKLKSLVWLLAALLGGLVLVPSDLVAEEASSSKPANTQQYGNVHWFPSIWGPYTTPYVQETRMSNSDRLRSLVRDGKLYLSVSDAIALALENNLAPYFPLPIISIPS